MLPTSKRRPPLTFLVLATVAFVAHFVLFTQFGLYEDDYIYTLESFNMGLGDWASRAWDALIHPIQARPLNHLVRRTLFALTLQGNTLDAAYLASWTLVSVNAWLLYRLLARRLVPAAGAAAALLYLLHPADTARQIIMHQTDIHVGTFLLLSSLSLFLANRPVLAWLVGSSSLINYESFYLPLAIAPFILSPAPLREWRKTLGHLALWCIFFGGVATTRYLLGEDRATAAAESMPVVLGRIARALYIGPGTSLQLLIQRPVDALFHLTPFLAVVSAAVSVLSYRLLRSTQSQDDEAAPTAAPDGVIWVVAGGLIGLIVSYLFAFRGDSYPPVVTIGRLTALHAPGVLCTAIAAGAAFAWAVSRRGNHHAAVACGSLAACFGLMGAFATQIQLSEYVAHWTKQRDFWREIFAQSKDLADGETIIVDVEGSEEVIPITPGFPRFGTVNYPPYALRRFANIPAEWTAPPRVYGLWTDTPAKLENDGLHLGTPPHFGPSDQAVIRNGAFIYFRAEGGRLMRVVHPVEIRGFTMNPKPVPATPAPYQIQPSALYRGLFEPRSGLGWFTIRNSRNYPR